MSTEDSCRCVTEQMTRVTVADDVCRDIARWGEPYNPFKAPDAVQVREDRAVAAGEQQQPTAQPERIEQSGAVINGHAIAREQRALGSFPETPSFQSISYMTTPAIPTRL